ncbi:hypothetical protein ACFFSY_29890 [Paenibacillus aurantiacus]|uniref:YqzE family protein n=1 Tax=Paenibacillus aurantiacus TaxID=1936118 RepID=A0ABV5L028_9BACL
MRLHEEYMIEKLMEYAREERERMERRGFYRMWSETTKRRRKAALRTTAMHWLVRLIGIKR